MFQIKWINWGGGVTVTGQFQNAGSNVGEVVAYHISILLTRVGNLYEYANPALALIGGVLMLF